MSDPSRSSRQRGQTSPVGFGSPSGVVVLRYFPRGVPRIRTPAADAITSSDRFDALKPGLSHCRNELGPDRTTAALPD